MPNTSLSRYRTRRANERRWQQQQAVRSMELAFSKEKYEDSKKRQALADERAEERFDWATQEQNIREIATSASPITQTLKDPLDLTTEEFENIGNMINSFYAKYEDSPNEAEQSSLYAQKELLDSLYANASTYREATGKITSIRTALDNLVGEYKDEHGNMVKGEFNTKNVNDIIANIQNAIASYSKSGSEEIVKMFQSLETEASQTAFVAAEIDRYYTPDKDGKRLVDTMQNRTLAEVVKKAKTAQEVEEYGTAHRLLSGTGQTEEGFVQHREYLDNKKAQDDAADAMAAAYDEDRRYADHHIGIIKTAVKEDAAGVFAGSLSRLASFDTTKTNALTSPEDFKAYDNLMSNLINTIHFEDKGGGRYMDYEGFGFGGTDVLKSKHSGIANDMEATNLYLSGNISKNDKGHYVWANGQNYMLNTGGGGYEKVKGNQPGEFEFDENLYQNEIDANIRALDYSDAGGDKSKIRYGIASAASLWLKLSPDIKHRRRTTSDAARKYPGVDEISSEELELNASKQELTVEKVVSGEAPTSELAGITGYANVMNAMKGLKNTNAKFLIEFPDGTEQYIRAKEWQGLGGMHSDSSQVKGMSIKMVTNIGDKHDPESTNKPPEGESFHDSSNLRRAERKLARAEKNLRIKPVGSRAHSMHLAQKKEAEEIIAKIKAKK
jgi:hypothetical protein